MDQFIPKNLKAFWISFVAIFIMVILQHVGLHLPQLVSPLPASIQKEDIFPFIRDRLQQQKNVYTLKKKTSFLTIPKAGASGPYDDAAGYVVVNYDTGEVLAEKNGAKQLPIASITKIMTAVVALDLATANEHFTASKKASTVYPTRMGVLAGHQYTLEELLNGLLLTSGNDAAVVIKEGIDAKFNDAVFIKAMNEKAHLLGLSNTHFQNPHGFDAKDHYSSPEDLAVLSHYALEHYPLIAAIVKKESEQLPANGQHGVIELPNWNGLLGVYPNVFGIKIGNTDNAGTTTVVASERDGKRVLVVVLGAPGILERDGWATQLLNLGFEEYGLPPVILTYADLRQKYRTWDYWYAQL